MAPDRSVSVSLKTSGDSPACEAGQTRSCAGGEIADAEGPTLWKAWLGLTLARMTRREQLPCWPEAGRARVPRLPSSRISESPSFACRRASARARRRSGPARAQPPDLLAKPLELAHTADDRVAGGLGLLADLRPPRVDRHRSRLEHREFIPRHPATLRPCAGIGSPPSGAR